MEKETTQMEVEELKTAFQLNNQEIDALNIENEQLKISLNQMSEQQSKINSDFIKWFAQEGNTTVITQNTLLLEQLDVEKTNQSLYQMGFIANRFFFVNIQVDTTRQHQVIINGESTPLQLNLELYQDELAKEKMKASLFDAIEKVLGAKDGGYQYVLLTVKDDGTMYKYAADLIWSVFSDIETKFGPDKIHKLQYYSY